MKQHADFQAGSGHHKNGAVAVRAARNGAADSPFDFWWFAEILLLGWRWPVVAGATLAAAGLLFGMMHWKSGFTAPAQLISYNSPNATEVFGEHEVSPQTLISVLHSPDLLAAAGTQAVPPVSAASLMDSLSIMPDRNSDIIVAAVTERSPQRAVELANLYANAAVLFTQKLQAGAATEMDQFFSRQLTNLDAQIASLDQQAGGLSSGKSASVVVPTGPIRAQLSTARSELVELLAKYTDAHPLVQAKRSEIGALEKELGPVTENSTASTDTPAVSGEGDPEVVRGKLEALEHTRLNLLDQRQAVRAFEANPPGFCKLLAPATPRAVVAHGRSAKVFFLAVLAAMIGLVGGAAGVLLAELADENLKTASDVRRVTKLPVLAATGDLSRLTEYERYDWAFRTWTRLQGRLSPSPNHGLVLGVTSAGNGEGRSTWVKLLAEAASLMGFRVLTIATRPSKDGLANGKHQAIGNSDAAVEDIRKPNSPPMEPENSVTVAADANILATPAEVTEKLTRPDSQPVVHIPLPGWVWNLERRKQWQDALHHWSKIENVVILVELPPASVPEAVLLAENLPNVVWLSGSGQAAAGDTLDRLETLRSARCHLAGSVLNRAPKSFLKRRLARWVACAALALGISISAGFATDDNTAQATSRAALVGQLSDVNAQPSSTLTNVGSVDDNTAQAAARTVVDKQLLDTNGLPSSGQPGVMVVAPPATSNKSDDANEISTPGIHGLDFAPGWKERAGWQQHFTLGAGDVLNFSLFNDPELTVLNVPVAPDGRVSYLEAQGVMAAGLTVDELRAKLDEELAKYRRAPRTIITPVEFNSKKYFLLGNVARAGAYTLDQPTTIVEAIARARGFTTALQQRNVVDIADLQHAFVARQGRRLPLDFEKLFLQGDLSQNILLAPDDYVYIPPAEVKQVYVLGEVQTPGPVAFNARLSSLGAIAADGGFTRRAWKQKVLVIRGSLNHPQAIVVDAGDVLAAGAEDCRLQPNDIVYVHYRPWVKAEDILDIAATAFIQSAIITWTGIHTGPLISTPIIE